MTAKSDLPQGALDWKKTETGREAKFYRLTRKGRAQLEMETASWHLIFTMSEGGAQ